jgi:asparagine synthase (glutamine-hydrolysing)
MCGICGELRFDGRPVHAGVLTAMRDELTHRGPDSFGVYLSPTACAGLGFRRLRIIDLTANGGQPMPNEDGTLQLVFNGEIYNFPALRRDLIERGHRFRSQADSEVILHLYEEKGPDCVSDLEGMFAFALWDESARRMVLARDRAGKKPLFYFKSDHLFAFASEVKSLFSHPGIAIDIDPESVPYYFIYGYVPGPSTFYKHVYQIEPGSLMTVDEQGRSVARRYWRIQYPEADTVKRVGRLEAAAGVRERLTRAVERRLISDVPLGAFLSGGLDSTIIVGLMSRFMSAPVRTFSVGFDGDKAYDETGYARQAANRFATLHTEFHVSPSALELIDKLLWHHDGPFGDSSAVPTFIVSRLTRQHVTVVLTGDGGDELFAGYRRFYAAMLAERIPAGVSRSAAALLSVVTRATEERRLVSEARRFFRAAGLSLDERLTRWNALFFEDLGDLLRADFTASLGPIDRLKHIAGEQDALRGRSGLSRALHANFISYLADDLLVKTDRCTMANALEARSPFLDRELVEYVAALPDEYKLRGRQAKSILREAFADLLPKPIARRPKMGFGVPVGRWFRGELRDYLRDVLLTPGARYREMLSSRFVEKLVAQHLAGMTHAGPQLWSLVCFERWLQLLPDWKRHRSRSTLAEQMPLSNLSTH